jgi:hypothetical protein
VLFNTYFSIQKILRMEIFKPISAAFDFSKITLATPQPFQGNSYFTKINFGAENVPLYIQFPKCLTKQAVIATKRGKYCDLMYERGINDEFIEWIEHLESACQDKIDEKKHLWFQNEFTRDDIETMMTPIARMYKSGKYLLIRAYINENKHTGKDKCVVYNENEVNVDLETINEETYIIPLLLIDGIKFTSRSFEIDIKIVQIMVLDKSAPQISACLIKKTLDSAAPLQTVLLQNAPLQSVPFQQTPTVASHTPLQNAPLQQTPTPLQQTHILASHILASHTPLQTPPTPLQTAPIQKETMPKPSEKENTLFSPPLPLEKSMIEEIQIDYETISDSIILKKPNEVYYEQYRLAKKKAIEMRENTLSAILEAKGIKQKYNLEVDDDSDDLDEDF